MSGILIGLLLGLTENTMSAPHPYIYQHLDREDGLASSIVLAILQDRDGYMWFGTDNGLQRYDGRQFLHYRYNLNNPNSLASDIVEALLQDDQGNLWIASPAQVTRYSPSGRTFTRIPIQTAARFTSGPRRWRLRQCQGTIILEAGNQQEQFVFAPNQKAFVLPQSAGGKIASCLRKVEAAPVPQPSVEPYVYLKDNRGTLWAASGQLWARAPGATNFDLIPQRDEFRHDLVFDQIYSISQNQEGTIWLGTNKGVYYFNPGKQRFFSVGSNTRNPAVVSGFLETAKGEIWAATLNQGIQVYDQEFSPLRNYASGGLQVWCLVEDRQHRVWAGASDGTLLLMEPGKSAIRHVTPPALAGQNIMKATVDASGQIWWGTHQGLLVRYDPETGQFKSFSLQKQAPSQTMGQIKRLLFGLDGTLWLATAQAGVLRVDPKTGKIMAHYSTASRPKGLLSNAVGEMIWYDDHTLAISTSLGIHFLNVQIGQITALTTANGLPSNTILNLVKTGKNLFFTTQFSLGRWNTQTKTVTGYGAQDGLVNESYAFNTGYTLKDGRILMGTLQGFYYFHPDSLNRSAALPKVAITGFKVFDKNLTLNKAETGKEGLHLAHNLNFFTVEFASLSYYDDAKIQYEYQLEGVDQTWRQAGRNRFASYTNLDGGDYLFKVRARRDDGATTPQVTTLRLVISDPFWKTWWFLGLVFLLVVLGLYGLYRLRINRLLGLQAVRTRIARDLHDDMGSTLSTITIFSDMANQQVLANPVLAQGYLQKISRYSHQMMTVMDDIVWSINPHNDLVQNLVSRMREVATEVLEAKDITFCLEADPAVNNLRLGLEARYDFFMIFKEAINNIAKYSHCRQVWMKVKLQENNLRLEIRDDGQGFDTAQASTGNGLLNMQKRAQNIRATLDISSAPGQGTTVSLTAPLSKTAFHPLPV
ncbi:sensor histidine kinase [Rufibacter aurantiacus]|uniref:sensor histidine kinase n=1 Tax=Rufibacter aurantiacus TaxID=2817374 RepID=UPI001B30D789|nr:sensor histidine kinase [Rufibacter aurantiacus]